MTSKTFVKICGITRSEDLKLVVEQGADAVGFIAFPKSPRYVSPDAVSTLLGKVDTARVNKVAVFVNASLDEVNSYLEAGVDVIQLHGDESAEFANSIDAEIWRAIRLCEEAQVDEFKNFPCDKFLIDSFVKNSEIPGGTGHVANWELAQKFVQAVNKDVLLAGGINEDNLAEAMKEVNPFGVDLSSKVEIAPGIKDHAKLNAFFEAVRNL